MEAFVKLLEALAELGDIHLMTFNEHMMFRMLTASRTRACSPSGGASRTPKSSFPGTN